MDGVRLGPWEEVVGILDSVETHEEKGVLRITLIRRFSLEIPLNPLTEGDLSLAQFIGKRISILRTNSGYILNTSSQDDDAVKTIPRG